MMIWTMRMMRMTLAQIMETPLNRLTSPNHAGSQAPSPRAGRGPSQASKDKVQGKRPGVRVITTRIPRKIRIVQKLPRSLKFRAKNEEENLVLSPKKTRETNRKQKNEEENLVLSPKKTRETNR